MNCPSCGSFVQEGQECPCQTHRRNYEIGAVREIIRIVVGSPQFLTATIFYLVAQLLNVLNAIMGYNAIEVIHSSFLPYQQLSTPNALDAQWWLSVAFSSAISIILVVGLFSLYRSAKRIHEAPMTTWPLTFLKVMFIIAIIIIAIAIVITSVAIIMVTFLRLPDIENAIGGEFNINPYAGYDMSRIFTIVMSVILFFIAAICVLYICYAVSCIKTINAIKYAAMTGMINKRISGFAIGFTYFLAVMGIVGSLSSVFITASSTVFMSPLIISCYSVAQICSGLGLFLIANRLGALKAGMRGLAFQLNEDHGYRAPGYEYIPPYYQPQNINANDNQSTENGRNEYLNQIDSVACTHENGVDSTQDDMANVQIQDSGDGEIASGVENQDEISDYEN